MTNLFVLVALTSYRYKYLLADIAGWKVRKNVRPLVNVTHVIGWLRVKRGEENNTPSQLVISSIGERRVGTQCTR